MRSQHGTLVIAVLAFVAWCPQVYADIYESDFSSDPFEAGWTTNNSARFYWDEPSQDLFADYYTNSGDWATMDLTYAGESFFFGFDIKPHQVSGAGDVTFGLLGPTKTTNSSSDEERLYLLLGGNGQMYVDGYDAGGEAFWSGYGYGLMADGAWHHVEIAYDADSSVLSVDVTRDVAPTLDWHWQTTLTHGFSDFSYLGASMVGEWATSDRHATAHIDNVSFVPEPATLVVNLTTGVTYGTIQAAIDEASNGDEIEAGPGTYNEVINYLNKEIVVRSSDGPAATTIDGTGLNDRVVKCVEGQGRDTVLEGFTITGGTGSPGGGGMLNDNGCSLTVTNCVFEDNNAGADGGGMANWNGSSPKVVGCTFRNNTAPYGVGGGMFNAFDCDPVVVNCTFTGNGSQVHGGGMGNVEYCDPEVTNCLFMGNTTVIRGGAVDNRGANCLPTFTNCTFVANTCAGDGGGMTVEHTDPTIRNCIFWGNSDSGGTDESAQIHVYNGTVDVTHSCIQGLDTFAGNGNIGDDPVLTTDGHLWPISPCIDAGDTDAVPAGLFVDLAGSGRVLDWPATPDSGVPATLVPVTVDMGAYEFRCPVGDTNGDGYVDFDDIDPFVAILSGG